MGAKNLEVQSVNKDFGYPIRVEKNEKNLRERVRILKAGITSGKWKGKKLEKAEMHLGWYSKELLVLLDAKKDSKKRSKSRAN